MTVPLFDSALRPPADGIHRPLMQVTATGMARPIKVAALAVVTLVLLISTYEGNAARENALRLWYAQPAAEWNEALPVGNGHMGAMIFGGLEEERIQFNEDTLWRGKPHDYVREGAGAHLYTMQQLIFDDDVERLLARGGFEVDMEWRNGALARAVIRSKLGLPVRIRCGEREALLKTTAGQNYALDGRREFVQ